MRIVFSAIGISLLLVGCFMVGWRELVGLALVLFGISGMYAATDAGYKEVREQSERMRRGEEV